MSRFFTSDLHIRHDLVVRERGFGRADGTVDHDAYEAQLAENWDSRVHRTDHVYILGDLAMNPNKGAFEWLLERLGHKVLISGNHDSTHPLHSTWLQATQKWLGTGLFDAIVPQGSVKINGTKVLLSHFPYRGEGERKMEDRYTEWRFRDEGLPLLHGHTHSTTNPADVNQLHVGLDAWNLELVHELSVQDWLERKEFRDQLSQGDRQGLRSW